MRKLLTRAIAATVLLTVFSVYGDTSNLVFYSDFENSEDGQPIITSSDLSGATLVPPGAGLWQVLSLHRNNPANSQSEFRRGAVSQVAHLALLSRALGVSATLSEPAPFKGPQVAVQFSYDFQPNSGSKGTAHIITGFDINQNPVFTIKMNSIGGSPQFLVTVNGQAIGYANRNADSANPLNSISLILDNASITATLFNPSTGTKTVYGIPILGGPSLSRFKLESEKNLGSNFDYDNFQVWAISRVPPPPRLDLYMVSPE